MLKTGLNWLRVDKRSQRKEFVNIKQMIFFWVLFSLETKGK